MPLQSGGSPGAPRHGIAPTHRAPTLGNTRPTFPTFRKPHREHPRGTETDRQTETQGLTDIDRETETDRQTDKQRFKYV